MSLPHQTKPSQLSRRLDGVSESATLKLNAAVQAMKAQGVDVVNLTAGEPDFAVLEPIKDAAIAAVKANKSKYTPVPGIPELREAIAARTNGQQPSVAKSAPWKAKDVVVANGGKQAIFNTILALLDQGDEVLIPSPYWLSYPEIVKLAGGIPKFIHAPLSQGFRITPAQLKAALGPRVKAVIFNSPSNPTGAMYSRAEFRKLAEVLLELPAADRPWVISDEIYDTINFGEVPFTSFAEAAPELRDRVVTVNGLSKSGAMTGWRVGWSVAAEPLTSGLITLQGQSTSGINALGQWAGVAALTLPPSAFSEGTAVFKRRRDLALEILRKAAKMELAVPQGAFYIFVGIGKYLAPGEDSMGFAERLLQGAKVATVPGTPFGEPAYLRLSFATDDRSLEEGCRRITDFLRQLG